MRLDWSVRRWLATVAGVALVVLMLAGALFSWQAVQARSALVRAQAQAQELQKGIANNDQKAAQASLDGLRASTADARSKTGGFLWELGARSPVFGDDVEAVRVVSRVLSEVAESGLQSLVSVADQIDAHAFSPKDGTIDVAGVKTLASPLARADRALLRARRQMAPVDPQALVGPLQGPLAKLKTEIDEAQSTVSAGTTASRLLPSMLGGTGKRSYILAFQNNAEVRSTGGLPGAYAILRADDGHLKLTDQGAATDFGYFDPPVVKLSTEERNLYSNLMASFWGDSTFTPDFPRAAGIMRAMLKQRTGLVVDGVISVDPIALSYILEGTGPVKLADGTSLTSANAVQILLNGVYLKFGDSPEEQDTFFADAARRIFGAVASGRGNPTAVLKAMARAVKENRILVASANQREQRVLESTRIAGVLPGDSGTTPRVGLFLNDSTETKLEYYLRRQTTVDATGCTDRGVQRLSLTTILTSKAPRDAASLPDSILGPGTGEKRGSMRINLRYYAPHGGDVESLTVDGVPVTVNFGAHKGRRVGILPVLLAPGQKVTVVAEITSGSSQRRDTVFTTTPGIEATPNNVRVPSTCAD